MGKNVDDSGKKGLESGPVKARKVLRARSPCNLGAEAIGGFS